MNIEDILKNKNLSKGSIELYTIKLKKLNDNKQINNLNFLKNSDVILKKIANLKPSTQRSYIISICSVLKAINEKKYKKMQDMYLKILLKYNSELKDNTQITDKENKNWKTVEEISEIYDKIKKDILNDPSKENYQKLLLLTLYTKIAPRRSKDYQLMKVVNNYNENMPKEFNYLDLENHKFYFCNYKTARSYGIQSEDIPDNIFSIIVKYLKVFELKNNDFLIVSPASNKEYTLKNSFTFLLNKIFGNKISVSMLRKIYLTDKYGGMEEEMKKDAASMSTSVAIMHSQYIKKM